jgi:hypothetical protein
MLRGAKDKVKVPVKVELVEDGEDLDVEFVAVFRRLTKPKAREIRNSLRDVQIDIDVFSAEEGNLDLSKASDINRKREITLEMDALIEVLEQPIKENLIGWEKLTGEDGAEIPYSEEIKGEMLSLAPYFEALQLAFSQATGKRKVVAIKN